VAAFTGLLALGLLLCAAAVDDPAKGDPDSPLVQARAASVRSMAVAFQAVAYACAAVAVYIMRDKQDGYSPVDAEAEEPKTWTSALLSRRVLLMVAYLAVAAQLSVALALTGPRSKDAWAGPPLIAAPTVFALLVGDSFSGRKRTVLIVACLLAAAVGSFYTSAHVYRRACGERYGADQPAVSAF
jgi:hypothetical protein